MVSFVRMWLDFTTDMSVVALMSDEDSVLRDRLQEIAAQLMASLEDAHEAARRAQAPGASIEQIVEGLEEVEAEINIIGCVISTFNHNV